MDVTQCPFVKLSFDRSPICGGSEEKKIQVALRLKTKYVTASDNPPVTPYGSDHVKKKYVVFSKGGGTGGHNKGTKQCSVRKEARNKTGPVKLNRIMRKKNERKKITDPLCTRKKNGF